MAVFQGAPLPDIKETTQKTTEAPGYYTDYLSGLSQAGTSQLGKTPDQLVAPLTALQQQGYAAIPGAATSYQPQLGNAEQTAAQAAGISSEDISRFMNPYTQNVVEEMQRLSEENVRRNVMPSLKGAFVGRGDLGSRRYAGATGQSLADIQRNLTGQQFGALSAGFNKAADLATSEAQLQNQVAQTQTRQAQIDQELGLAGAKAMTTAGGEQQAYEQARLESPLKTATAVSKLMQGQQVPMGTLQTFTGPKAGSYRTSELANVTGLSTFLASSAAGKSGAQIVDLLKSLGIKGSGPAGSYTAEDVLAAQTESQNEAFWGNLLRGESTSIPQYLENSAPPANFYTDESGNRLYFDTDDFGNRVYYDTDDFGNRIYPEIP
jgi:hypothetical protein